MHGRQPSDFKLDMPFDEALERFAGADPREMRANIKKSKQKKPPGGKRTPPGSKAKNVVSLRERKTRLRAKGRA